MYGLQEIFEQTIDRQIKTIKLNLVTRKFREFGIKLSSKQSAVAVPANGEFQLDLSPSQLAAARKATGQRQLDKITINLSDADIEEETRKFSAALEVAIPKSVEESADFLARRLRKRVTAEVRGLEKREMSFQRGLIKNWKRPLQLLEVFIAIVKEAAERFHYEYAPAEEDEDFVYEVVIRLHARACHTASEVLALLKNGFADGAHARWRTVHELATVALFVQKHGSEVAERYLAHEAVETYKGALQFQKYCKAIRQKPFPKRTIARFQTDYDKAAQRYGKSFKSDYGWAASALSNQQPKFFDLERDVGLDRFRPYYKMASQNVHATTKGMTHKLGLLPWFDILLLERSDIGLADPLHGTAISLQQITSPFITMKPTIDVLTLNAVLTKLQRQIGEESFTCHKAVEAFYESQLAKLSLTP